ncbi:MAG: hypothetical protein AB1405_07075 [Bdellovibrionota bacterium]
MRRLLIIFLLLGAQGCRYWARGTGYPDLSAWPPEKSTKGPSLQIKATLLECSQNGKPCAYDGFRASAIEDDYRNRAKIHYLESHLFSEIYTSSEERKTNFTADIRYRSTQEYSTPLSLLSFSTLLLVPNWMKETGEAKTIFLDSNGRELLVIEKKLTGKMWFNFFLLFSGPFSKYDLQDDAVQLDLDRATILEARRQGLFQETPPVP